MLNVKLRELREIKGVQQKDVAEDLGISRQVYNNYELGKREPDFMMLVRLAEYFGKTTDFLLSTTPPQQKKESTPRERLIQEINGLIDTLPDEVLANVKERFHLIAGVTGQ